MVHSRFSINGWPGPGWMLDLERCGGQDDGLQLFKQMSCGRDQMLHRFILRSDIKFKEGSWFDEQCSFLDFFLFVH